MHRHHRYARAIATGYGEVRVQIPLFCCGQCRRMTGGMTLLLGDEMRRQRFSKKNRDTAISLAEHLIELRPRRKPGGLPQECGLPVTAEAAFGCAAVAAVRNAGNGRAVDATRSGRTELKAIRAAAGTALGWFWLLGRSD